MKRHEVDFIEDIPPLIIVLWEDIVNNGMTLKITVKKERANVERISMILKTKEVLFKINFSCKKCLFSGNTFKIKRLRN